MNKGHPIKTMVALLGIWVGARIALYVNKAAEPAPLAQKPAQPAFRNNSEGEYDTGGAPMVPHQTRRQTTLNLHEFAKAPPSTTVLGAGLAAKKQQFTDGKPRQRPAHFESASLEMPIRASLPANSTVSTSSPPRPMTKSMEIQRTESAWRGNLTSASTDPVPVPMPTTTKSRSQALTLSAWSVLRPGGQTNSSAPGGQLGGSQLGMRGSIRLFGDINVPGLQAYARFSAPLASINGREGAVGLSARFSSKLPIEIGVERRVALSKGGRNAWGIVASGGLYRKKVSQGLYLNGYAQAGFVGRRARDGFVDGALSISAPVSGQSDLGIGLWGGAQPGISRLDVGPEFSKRLHLAGRSLRLGFGWRQRIAGDAAPKSGPALTLGADF